MPLTISLATRGRPTLMIETVRKTLRNIVRTDTILFIAIDDDDQGSIGAIFDLPKDARIVANVGPREDSFGGKYNRALRFAQADIYLQMVDHSAFATYGFDQKIIDAAAIVPDGICTVYNRHACLAFPSMRAVTKQFVQKMGYFYCPYFPFSWVDNWLDDITRMIGRDVFCDIELDQTERPPTMDRRDVKLWSVLLDALWPERERLARDIVSSPDFEEPRWRKEELLARIPLIESWSRYVNRSCRINAAWFDRHTPPPAEKERYVRLKKRGLASLRAAMDGNIDAALRIAEGGC